LAIPHLEQDIVIPSPSIGFRKTSRICNGSQRLSRTAEEDKIAEAISGFEKASGHLGAQWSDQSRTTSFDHPHAGIMDLLARAYRRPGDLDKAREKLEKITILTTARQLNGALYAKSFTCWARSPSDRGIRRGLARIIVASLPLAGTPTPAPPWSKTPGGGWSGCPAVEHNFEHIFYSGIRNLSCPLYIAL
jgi:hypothetical protein